MIELVVKRVPRVLFLAVCVAVAFSTALAAPPEPKNGVMVLKAWGVPDDTVDSIDARMRRTVLNEFRRLYPHIRPVSATGLTIPGRPPEIVSLMQIAGGIPADVMFVNFAQSDTYIRQKFLYPLERFIEQQIGLEAGVAGGHLMDTDTYLDRLRQAPDGRYERELAERVPRQAWDVIRRKCPYAADCPFLRKWVEGPSDDHHHVWAFPEYQLVMGLLYRKDLFSEAGLPDRAPTDWEEMLAFARTLHNPRENRYGVKQTLQELSWGTMSFLYSAGGLMVDQDEQGQWHCVFDSEEAVEAYFFVARLFLEPFENEYGRFTGVVYLGENRPDVQYGMQFSYLDEKSLGRLSRFSNMDLVDFGPVPLGPTGIRGSEYNCSMTGIYAGLIDDDAKALAAWRYVHFLGGPQARKVNTSVYVHGGWGKFVPAHDLEAAGYPEIVRQVPKAWGKVFRLAREGGIPEPYGKNCQLIYKYVSQALGAIRASNVVADAIEAGDEKTAKDEIRGILQQAVRTSNAKMLNILPPQEQIKRNRVGIITACGIFAVFVLLFRRVFRVFRAANPAMGERRMGHWEFGRYKWAYVILIPAVLGIVLFQYYPLARGTVMAFQDYNVRGFSRWVGIENFANVLYDGHFWYSMWISLKYTLLFMCFGFVAPIVLAFLLTEVPRAKMLFRTLFYLPAVLAGVVTIFLWKGFYGEYGMINAVVNFFVGLLNHLPGLQIAEVHTRWLDVPELALFFCLLPVVWAGMGPGCLIYLAALKTIPEELYEAADIDGAGIWHKVFDIAVPGIRALIMINFIGAMVGAMKTGGEYMLAMTGGGPYTPKGQTEVVGLHIYWQAFGYLRFGAAVAMAWVLGAMLLGFTVIQLQKISKVEFKTASGV